MHDLLLHMVYHLLHARDLSGFCCTSQKGSAWAGSFLNPWRYILEAADKYVLQFLATLRSKINDVGLFHGNLHHGNVCDPCR